MADQMKENECASKSNPSTREPGRFFEIQVKGQLDDSWSDWLGGLEVTLLDSGDMLLAGYIIDQAALMSILNKIYSLNLAIQSVSEIEK